MPATQAPKVPARRDVLPHGHWPAAGDALSTPDYIRVRCICHWQSAPIHECAAATAFLEHIRGLRRAH